MLSRQVDPGWIIMAASARPWASERPWHQALWRIRRRGHVYQTPGFALGFVSLELTEGDSYAMLVNQASSQDAAHTLVVPSDSSTSLLFLKVSSNDPPVGATMPFIGGRLSSEELALMRDWIDQGALDN